MMVVDRPDERLRARMFNPDGSEDTCGNGTLCAAVFAQRRGLVDGDRFEVDIRSGRAAVALEGSDRAGVCMGRPDFRPAAIPAATEGRALLEHNLALGKDSVTLSAVSTGTAHAVIFASRLPDDEEFLRLAPLIERHAIFPEGASVSWARVESLGRVQVRVWERGGVGESLSCGTGACAVAAVGQRLRRLDRHVTVVFRGGKLVVDSDAKGGLWLHGRPQVVYAGHIPIGEGPA